MPFVTRRSLFTLTLLGLVAALALGLFVWSGLYNVGADDTHTRPVYAVLQAIRSKSIEHHSRTIDAPDLADPDLIRSGAGNYAAMCTGCHLSPGADGTELSKGLYPAPPNLTRARATDPRHDFWIIKHGIKASGMPAWGKSMEDGYIWGLVAFLQQLPKLDDASYDALVASSGGHSHGGGEHGDDHHAAGSVPSGTSHVHADGRTHVHTATQEPMTMPMPEEAATHDPGKHQH